MKNYYKLLGVTEHATHADIHLAYQSLCKKYKCNNGSNVQDVLIDISVAYQTLTNQRIRKEYDLMLKTFPASENVAPISLKESRITVNQQTILWMSAGTAALALLVFFISLSNRSRIATIAAAPPVEISVIKPVKSAEPATVAVNGHHSKPLAHDRTVELMHPIAPAKVKELLVTGPAYIATGIVRNDVIRVQGTPDVIMRVDGQTEVWRYDNSEIVFEKGLVTKIYNRSNNLKLD